MNQDLVSLIDHSKLKKKFIWKLLNISRVTVPDWLQTISRGSLLYPNEQLWEVAKTMEEEFYKMHGKSLSKHKSIFHQLANQTLAKLKTIQLLSKLFCVFLERVHILDLEN
nr:unnamed protein product [Callosobruchus chinensis]